MVEENKIVKKAECTIGIAALRNDGILTFNMTKEHYEISEELMLEAMECVASIVDKPTPVLAFHDKSYSVSAEALRVLAHNEKAVSAVGTVVFDKISKVTDEIIADTVNAPYPFKVFVSEEDAVTWLKGFLCG